MPKNIIRPIPICKFRLDKGFMTYRMNYGQTIDLISYIWYIETPEAKVIIDTASDSAAWNARGYPGSQDIQSVEQGLGKYKLKPEDIDIVILTHLHWDHLIHAPKFKKAKFIIQKTELDFGLKPHPVVAHSFEAKLFKDLNFEIVDGDKEILKGIKVIFTPGHSPGGQSMAVDMAKGLAVITGFCCSGVNFEPPDALKARGVQVITPGLHTNTFQAYDSTLKVKQIADIVVPMHEISFLDRESIP